jgi:CheY-like chemotaxis protein
VRTLLLVDDEDDQRILTRMCLNELGYAVVTAASAQQALELFDPRIHELVVTDNSMPGMSGTELARRIKHRSPATPVLMLTGCAPAPEVCLDKIIQRPVLMEELRTAVGDLLKDVTEKPRPPFRPTESPGDG